MRPLGSAGRGGRSRYLGLMAIALLIASTLSAPLPLPLTVVPITDTEDFAPLRFQFDIAMGVRKGDHALKARLDDIIARKQPEIRALLESYGVPLVQASSRAAETGTR